MPIVPTSSGEIFESSVKAFFAGIEPTQVLAKDHLFRTLWLDFLNTLTTPEKCNDLIDAYVSLFLGDPQWRQSSSLIDTHRAHIRNQLRHRPPNVVIVDLPHAYGWHRRVPHLWSFICISQRWVDKWVLAMQSPETDLALSLEALLKASLAHEGGHFYNTLRTGPYSKKSLDIMNLPLMEMEPALDKLSRDELQEFAGTTKSMAVVWRGDEAEAGSFVEVEGGGGIVTINDVYDAVIQTDANTTVQLPRRHLLDLRLQGYIRFKPKLYEPSLSPSSSQPQASPIKQKIEQTTFCFSSRLPFWPDRGDECTQLAPSGKAQIGLDVSWPLRPDCIRTSNANALAAAQRVLRMRESEATFLQSCSSLNCV